MLAMNPDTIMSWLLPQPRRIRSHGSICLQSSNWQADVQLADSRIDNAVLRLVALAKSQYRTSHTAEHETQPVPLRIGVDRTGAAHQQGYTLTIAPGQIELTGGSAAGCFYGLQTLRQLVKAMAGDSALPCCTIEDEPDFPTRGLLHDVTRGKVPTLHTLKHIADRLAAWKGNQLQLYIEHAFVYSFDPDICDETDGLTPLEICELDAYCRERFIDLVPAVATFGHMGRILSMPRYRHLAEIEAGEPWERMPWPQRARGLTLDCLNPEAHRLVEYIWSDILDAFSSNVVNICGDEPWDLGRGKNSPRLGNDHGDAYLDHIRRTHDYCVSRGRSTQFWSDVLRNYPALFHKVPRDATVLHWGYDDKTDYEATHSLVNADLNVYVCPGTRGWKRLLNALDAAERNIHSFAQTGKQHGATGLINTDWGDHGHFNMLAGSWHAIALGAALAWSASHPTSRDFDHVFSQHILGVNNSGIVSSLRAASALADTVETWKLLWMPCNEIPATDWPDSQTLMESAMHAQEAARQLRQCPTETPPQCRADTEELILACRFIELLSHKFFSNATHTPQAFSDTHEEQKRKCPETLNDLAQEYARLWHRRNKPSGLNDILNALERIGREWPQAVTS
jgi:hypothetical protein